MTTLHYIAVAALVLGGAYLLLALVAYFKTRGRTTQSSGDSAGKPVVNIDANALIEGEPTATRMRKLAEICASVGRRSFSENLDYSIESIPAVDRAIMKGWGASTEKIPDDVILSFGAYVGEVLVRHSRGRWVSSLNVEEPATVLFLTRDKEQDTVNVSPFLLVREKFEKKFGWDLGIAFTALEQKLKELNAA